MNENPYASPGTSPTDSSSASDLSNAALLPLTETVVFDAALLSKYEQSMAGCLRPLVRTVAAIVGLAGVAVTITFLASVNLAKNPKALLAISVIGVPTLILIAWAIYQPQVSTWMLGRTLRKQGREKEKVQYTVSTEGVTVKSDIEVRQIPWHSFVARDETPDFVILLLHDGRQQLFPIAQLSPEFLDALRRA